MDKAGDPLINNRRIDYAYNLFLLAVANKKKKVWQDWLQRAREGMDQQSREVKDLNEKTAVPPEELQLPQTIKMQDGFIMKKQGTSYGPYVSYTIEESPVKKPGIIDRMLNKYRAGSINLRWDENTSSGWPPSLVSPFLINTAGKGLCRRRMLN